MKDDIELNSPVFCWLYSVSHIFKKVILKAFLLSTDKTQTIRPFLVHLESNLCNILAKECKSCKNLAKLAFTQPGRLSLMFIKLCVSCKLLNLQIFRFFAVCTFIFGLIRSKNFLISNRNFLIINFFWSFSKNEVFSFRNLGFACIRAISSGFVWFWGM